MTNKYQEALSLKDKIFQEGAICHMLCLAGMGKHVVAISKDGKDIITIQELEKRLHEKYMRLNNG